MALIAVVLVSMLMMALLAVTLSHETHADSSSARGRNFDIALGVAEAGVSEGVAKIEASAGTYSGNFSGQTPQGTYTVTVTKQPGRYILDARGTVGGSNLGRRRRVRVTMEPPASFSYALFSNTSIDLKNLDDVTGDVWANDSVKVDDNNDVDGSVTAARSWVELAQNSRVRKDVWSGGFNSSGHWAIKLANGAQIDGNAKASVSAPNDPTTCGGEASSDYEIPLGPGAEIGGDLTSWGVTSGSGLVHGTYRPNTCTEAAIPKPLPSFAYNANNYDAGTLHDFSSVSAFQAWISSGGRLADLHGTFYVHDPGPAQSNRIDLTGAVVTGDTTIVTNAPVFTGSATDSGSTQKLFVVASSYQPPAGSSCDVNHDASECAVHLKNQFQPSCRTAVLVYANRGPVAVKNNAEQCGAVYADSILVKNDQTLSFDARIQRVVGFGPTTFEVRRWEELAGA
jgi:hypothetical protein